MSLRTEYVDVFQTSPVILISSLVVLVLVNLYKLDLMYRD